MILNDRFFYSGRLDFTNDFQYRKLHFPVIDVDIWAEFLANIISHAHPHAAGYSEPTGQTTKTYNDTYVYVSKGILLILIHIQFLS